MKKLLLNFQNNCVIISLSKFKRKNIMTNDWIKVEKLISCLTADRIKHNVDYTVILKYGVLTITCSVIYEERIAAACDYYGLNVAHWFTIS